MSLNCTMPEFVNSSVGSLPGTSGLEGTIVWPLPSKYFRNRVRISLLFMGVNYRLSVQHTEKTTILACAAGAGERRSRVARGERREEKGAAVASWSREDPDPDWIAESGHTRNREARKLRAPAASPLPS